MTPNIASANAFQANRSNFYEEYVVDERALARPIDQIQARLRQLLQSAPIPVSVLARTTNRGR